MTAVLELTTATPAEIDAVLAELWYRTDTVKGHLASSRKYQAQDQKQRDQQAAAGHETTRLDRELAERDERIATYEADIAELQAQALPYETEYARRGGWQRYFIVKNGNGHIHRGMHCTTCYPTTMYGWLVELADCDEEAMVLQYGEKACTVCFPNAPTLPAWGEAIRRTAAEKEALRAEKLATRRARLVKAIATKQKALAREQTRKRPDWAEGAWDNAYSIEHAERDLRQAERGLAYFDRTGKLP
jgi:hypothetical protein